MSRKDPCQKVCYQTRAAAWTGAATVAQRTGTRLGVLHVYRCDTCTVQDGRKRAWHFGHRIGSGGKPTRVRR